MNLLAEKQKRIFDCSISDVERKRREDEFLKLYYQLRNKYETRFLGKMSLQTRKRLHPLVLLIYTVKNHLGGFTYEIIGNESTKNNRPNIFAVTHVGKFDIEVISEAIKEHYYLLSGDYEHIQGTVDAPFLAANGVLYFNENVQNDRISVTQKMIDLLNTGGNLMYFPEGTWNLSPNLPMLPCYWGIIKVAQESNAIITPIAAEQYGKHFKINIGKNFDATLFTHDSDGKSEAISQLRDIFATLKYKIWESEPQIKRRDLQGTEWDQYIKERFSEWPYFNLDYINRLIFKPPGITNSTEALRPLKEVIPTTENAFLFNKRLLPDFE